MVIRMSIECDLCGKQLHDNAQGRLEGLTVSSPTLENDAHFCCYTCLSEWPKLGRAKGQPEPFRITGPGLYQRRAGGSVRIEFRAENSEYPRNVWWTDKNSPANTWTDEGLLSDDGNISNFDLIKRIGD